MFANETDGVSRCDSTTTVASSVDNGDATPRLCKQCRLLEPNFDKIISHYKVDIKGSKKIQVGSIYYCYGCHPDAKSSYRREISERSCLWSFIVENKCSIGSFLISMITVGIVVLVAAAVIRNDWRIGGDIIVEPPKNPTNRFETQIVSRLTSRGESPLKTRRMWGATEPKSGIPKLKQPNKRIIVAQTTGKSCHEDCPARVREIQRRHSKLKDIPFNFLIGGDGEIYEGRGSEFEGQHTADNATSFNNIGICVAFIGTFDGSNNQPTSEQIKAFHKFIDYHFGFEIQTDYKIFLQDQLLKQTVNSDSLYDVVKDFDKFTPVQKIYTREYWNADSHPRCGRIERLSLPVDRLVLTDTEREECPDDTGCKFLIQILQATQKNNCAPRGYSDIAYGFMIGGPNGAIFEGRGFDLKGQATKESDDDISLSIAFIGNYRKKTPNKNILAATLNLIADAINLGKLRKEFCVITNKRQKHNIHNVIRKLKLQKCL